MLFRIIWKILGTFFLAFGITLLLPIFLAIHDEYIRSSPLITPPSLDAFIYTLLISIGLGFLFFWMGRKAKGVELYRKEGLLSVVLIWLIVPAIAALPFLFTGTLDKPTFAYFEAVSGLTTTGASVIAAKQYDPETGEEIPYIRKVRGEIDFEYQYYGTVDPIRDTDGTILAEGIEALARPLRLWRSFLQWLGGLGIVVLFIAILPALGVGGKVLFQAEMPGPLKETLTPRLIETAGMLWKIYLGLTIAEVLLLMFTNEKMTWFDAFAITFSTLSTGGFSVRNGSIGAYQNPATDWVVIAFMIFGSINFSLYYFCLKGRFYRLWDKELLIYLIILLISGTYAAVNLYGTEVWPLAGSPTIFGWHDAIRNGFFQVISANTSTGFATTNYDKWPYSVQVLMLILIYMGGMAGSTSGGIKTMRHIMAFRIVQDKVELMFRPETIRTFRIGERSVGIDAALTVLCFYLIILSISVFGVFLLSIEGIGPQSALGVVASTINNSGMGFREAGPTDSYGFLSDFGLILVSMLMILGRLEFFAVLVVLVPAFWRES